MAEVSGYTNKQELAKINNGLNLIKNEVMNTLTDNIPYIENCVMTTYVRKWKTSCRNCRRKNSRYYETRGAEKQRKQRTKRNGKTLYNNER